MRILSLNKIGCVAWAQVALAMMAITAAAAPRLAIEEPKWDFGEVYVGQQPEHIFKLKNTGDETLHITHVRSSCSACAGTIVSGREMEPGSTGEIKVVYHAKPGSEGNVSKFVTIASNDPDNAFQNVTITGKVKPIGDAPVLSVSPSPVDVGIIWKGQERVVNINLLNEGKTALGISGLDMSPGVAVLSGIEKVSAGGKEQLRLRILPDRQLGLVQEWVTLHTNDPVHTDTVIPVYGYCSAEAPSTASTGITVRPVGSPVAFPGTGRSIHLNWAITNNSDASVRISPLRREGAIESDMKAQYLAEGETVEFTIAPTTSDTLLDSVISIGLDIRITTKNAE